jgi:hypothetical protein
LSYPHVLVVDARSTVVLDPICLAFAVGHLDLLVLVLVWIAIVKIAYAFKVCLHVGPIPEAWCKVGVTDSFIFMLFRVEINALLVLTSFFVIALATLSLCLLRP